MRNHASFFIDKIMQNKIMIDKNIRGGTMYWYDRKGVPNWKK